jgi:hypothetical protein
MAVEVEDVVQNTGTTIAGDVATPTELVIAGNRQISVVSLQIVIRWILVMAVQATVIP